MGSYASRAVPCKLARPQVNAHLRMLLRVPLLSWALTASRTRSRAQTAPGPSPAAGLSSHVHLTGRMTSPECAISSNKTSREMTNTAAVSAPSHSRSIAVQKPVADRRAYEVILVGGGPEADGGSQARFLLVSDPEAVFPAVCVNMQVSGRPVVRPRTPEVGPLQPRPLSPASTPEDRSALVPVALIPVDARGFGEYCSAGASGQAQSSTPPLTLPPASCLPRPHTH